MQFSHTTHYSGKRSADTPKTERVKTPAIVESGDGLDWITTVTRNYSANSWRLLQRYESLPSEISVSGVDGGEISAQKPLSTFYYLDFDTKYAMLNSMSTNVHEIAHAYYSMNSLKYAKENGIKQDWDRAYGYIYVSPADYYYISVPKNILFPSKELVGVIPEKLHTFRFDTYIDGTTSTQSNGVVGLLNEFHAYYLGAKFSFDMVDVYRKTGDDEVEGIKEWITYAQSSMGAYYEFKFFILEYLHYMKRRNYNDYQTLVYSGNFSSAFKLIDKVYAKLINDYLGYINKEALNATCSGEYKLWLEDNTFWVQKTTSSRSLGTVIMSDDVVLLQPVINSDRYNNILADMGITQ
jgi:hypothetical protein